MRPCVPIPGFFRDVDFTYAIRKVKELGFDAIETYRWKDLDLEAVRNTCEETGVEFISMCTTEFNMTNPEMRQKWLDGLEESCRAANIAGVKHLITQVGNDTGEDRRYQHDSIMAALKAARPILEDTGVTIMIEPLNTLVNHPGYYLYTSVEAFEIIREVDHPLVKVVYDIYHQQVMEGNIIPNITNNLDCIAHMHAAGHPGRIELQFGENDYKNIFAAIDKAGYKGAVGLEYRPTLGGVESLRKFREIYMSDK
ncbi:MAG: TIM barrel protein [Clostridiales bacterium]|jgi:hydroxypyruvate isomerase|nr:TIM barrel protein [Clostridiales bacterium]